MRLSTNYTIHANIQNIVYCSIDQLFSFDTDDNDLLEVYGAKREDVIRLVRNFFVVDLFRGLTPQQLTKAELASLFEVKDALQKFLKEGNS